jgi:HTH-type transcriptional regulator, competence development regulator
MMLDIIGKTCVLFTLLGTQSDGGAVSLGKKLKEARVAKKLSLRDVERQTQKEISNGYLSLLESDSVREPSPKMLHTLAKALELDYTELMSLAGYAPAASPRRLRAASAGFGGVALSADDLTSAEQADVQRYIDLLRKARRGNDDSP